MKNLISLFLLSFALVASAADAPKSAPTPVKIEAEKPAPPPTIILNDGKAYTAEQITQAFTEAQQRLTELTNQRHR